MAFRIGRLHTRGVGHIADSTTEGFALVGWLLLQGLLTRQQLAGVSNVSALAHLGGAGVGVVAWLFWRETREAHQGDSFASLRRAPSRKT